MKHELKPETEIVLNKGRVGVLLGYHNHGYVYYVKGDAKKKPLYKGGLPVKLEEKERQTA